MQNKELAVKNRLMPRYHARFRYVFLLWQGTVLPLLCDQVSIGIIWQALNFGEKDSFTHTLLYLIVYHQ